MAAIAFKKRTILALLVAPFAPIVYFFTIIGFENQGAILLVSIFFILLAYIPGIILGLFLLVFLKKRGLFSFFYVLITGSAAGIFLFCVSTSLLSIMIGSTSSNILSFSDILWGAFFGFSVSVIFNFLAGVPFRREL